MFLTRIEILGYRGFRQRQGLDFAIPNGTPGGGLTILTGPNNAGKSSITECLRARSGDSVSFTIGTRNAAVEAIEIVYVFGEKQETIKSLTKGSSETVREGISDRSILVLPARRTFSPYFGKVERSRDTYVQISTLPAQRSFLLAHFEGRLFTILKTPDAFNDLLEKALGFRPTWTIDQSDQGPYFLKFFNGEQPHSSDGMGDGIVSVFAIVDSLYDSKPGDIIVIDEPELSLHPALQKRIARLLIDFSKDRQIIISTHSPYFVDLSVLASGGTLARVTATDGGTKIHQLSSDSRLSIKALSENNLHNPHVFGLDARELFFQEDHIILTEGQEDVLLYPKVSEQVGVEIAGNFFGWGVGGAGNMLRLCKILEDLGFRHVAALLDGDKASQLDKLRKSFPRYFFNCIPAADIRTKPARKASEPISGLLDEKLTVRPEFVEPLKTILSAVSTHLRAKKSAH